VTATSEEIQQRSDRIAQACELASEEQGPPGEGELIEAYFRHAPTEDLLERSPQDLLDIVRSHRELGTQRPAGTAKVACTTPPLGDGPSHTKIQIVTDDMPFLVDSVRAQLLSMGRGIHTVVHPILRVERDATGALVRILPDDAVPSEGQSQSVGVLNESWMHLEIDRESDAPDRDEIVARLRGVLSDVREAVEDWPKMRARARMIAAELPAVVPADIPEAEVKQAVELLDWLADNHFTFLACRDYRLAPTEGGTGLIPVSGSGLGLLRADPPMGVPRPALSDAVLAKATERRVLFVTKANSRSSVHRPVHLDYVGVKTFGPDGQITGERRILGLFTASAYAESVGRVPYLREKVAAVMRKAGFQDESHSSKDLLGILEDYPRDELFQADVDQLVDVGTSVLTLAQKRRARVFLRPDDYGRFVSALVYIPRDRYTTAVRLRVEGILREALHAKSIDYTARVSESPLARVHYVARLEPGAEMPDIDIDLLNDKIGAAIRTWDEDFRDAAIREVGEEAAGPLVAAYGPAFSISYKDDFEVAQGLADLRRLELLEQPTDTEFALYKPRSGDEAIRRFKLFRREPISLTRVLPLFTHMGVEVVDERPYELTRADGTPMYVYDFGLRAPADDLWDSMSHAELRELFEGAIDAVWNNRAESDPLGALVLRAKLTWRQVVILRAITKYVRQTQSRFSENYIVSALVHNKDIAADLVALFEARFDPDRAHEGREEAEEEIAARIQAALDDVSSLDEDRILRSCLGVIRAALRTNHFQLGPDGEGKDYFSIKLDPTKVPDLPQPRPAFEIWVYSPRVEGVHLRFGPVARGGLRWSDRREDFRTEILGLVKAQMVKNAVIVPTGSKGGFYAKQLPDPAVDRGAWLEEGKAAYRVFLSGLLDLSDNRVGTDIVPPERVVRHDGDDPYLVVAADKGTATFSDIANGVAQSYGFWLDDAFASGGSAGYDHKAMGITARGAWESVKRHFREMGIDTQSEDFTVVGVGDMSGDVFGNGMLLSEHIRLVAAFDHRHIFLDPAPDAAASYAERRRMFELPGSSWDDYDKGLLSEGGGVYPRSAKSVPVTPQVAEVLGIDSGVTSMTPAELIHAALLAPVDLLWNGGIGTYVKASDETHGEIGDRANDAIRVDGNQLRCHVVGEGGNLGLSQRGRIEAARSGVRLNTDAIDNSAGVATSDHEVNIKILLGQVMRDGALDLPARDELLRSMTDEVAADVLRDNYEQNVLLGNARAQQRIMLPVHMRFIRYLEEHGGLNRELEFLPSETELGDRLAAGTGLVSPEFCVLVAYSKLTLKRDLLASGFPDDPWLESELRGYFPPALPERFPEAVAAHPLRRDIIVTGVANDIVNRGGITFAYRATEETGASGEQIARAYVIAKEIFGVADYLDRVEALDNVVSTQQQTELYLEVRRLLDRAVRWFITARPSTLDVGSEIERYQPIIGAWRPRLGELLVGSERERLEEATAARVAEGVPEDLARDCASLLDAFSLLDIADICIDKDLDPAVVAPLYYLNSERLGVDKLLGKITQLQREDHWEALARGALRDDLYGILDAITRAVLDGAPAGEQDPDKLLDGWLTAHSETVQRAQRSLAGIDRLDQPTIAALSVALRTLRSVVRAGASEG